MSLTTENEPLKLFQTFLDENWVDEILFPKPELYVANDSTEAIQRLDITSNDAIVISPGSNDKITMRGNWVYYDRLFDISILVQTSDSRQRAMNLTKEVRAICFIYKYVFPGWQRVKYLGRREYVNTDLNIWRTEINIQLENYAILAETTLL